MLFSDVHRALKRQWWRRFSIAGRHKISSDFEHPTKSHSSSLLAWIVAVVGFSFVHSGCIAVSSAAVEPGIKGSFDPKPGSSAEVLISRGVTVKAVNTVSSARSEFSSAPEVFIPPGKMMITSDLTENQEEDRHYRLVLTEDGVWGFLELTDSPDSGYYNETWIRRLNTARDEGCFLWVFGCGELACSSEEVYAKFVIVTKATPATMLSSSSEHRVTLEPGMGFVLELEDEAGHLVHTLEVEPKSSECETQNTKQRTKVIIPSGNVKIIEIEQNLIPSFDKQDYVRAKKEEFIKRGFVAIPASKANTICGDKSTYQLSRLQETFAKQSVSAALKRLGFDGSYSIEWHEKITTEEKETKEKSPGRETYSTKYVSGDGQATATIDKIAKCQKDDNDEYTSLESDADWFYQFRHDYISHTFTFDCKAARLMGLPLDRDAGKIELNSLNDVYAFQRYLGNKDLSGSFPLLQREVTEWNRSESGDRCPN